MTHTLKTCLGTFALGALLIPVFAFAAWNDVVIGENVVIETTSYTFDAVATSSIESLLADTGNLNVAIAPGSSFNIRNTSNYLVDATQATTTGYSAGTQCESGATSRVAVSSDTASVTVGLTPRADVCASSGSGGGGGGGGSSTTSDTTTTSTTSSTPSSSTASATSGTPATPVTTETTTQTAAAATSGIDALMAQVNVLLAQLGSLQQAAGLPVTTLPSFGAGVSVGTFTRSLDVGSIGDDVLALQKFLNANGYVVAASGPGSPGNETRTFGGLTRDALAKYQAANGISPAVGYFGPLTRSHIEGSGSMTTPSSSSASSGESMMMSSSFVRDLDVGSTGADVKALQVFLNAKGYTVAESGPGSPGNETERFGALTRAALAKFQAAHGISPAVGYFGPKTRAKVNEM